MTVQCINSELNVVKILNNFCHSYLFCQAQINLLANTVVAVRLRQLKPVFHFTISLAAPRQMMCEHSGSLFIHYPDSPFNIRASSPGLEFILIYVAKSYSSVGHQYTWAGQTINLMQFHLGRTECQVVSYLRQTI